MMDLHCSLKIFINWPLYNVAHRAEQMAIIIFLNNCASLACKYIPFDKLLMVSFHLLYSVNKLLVNRLENTTKINV